MEGKQKMEGKQEMVVNQEEEILVNDPGNIDINQGPSVSNNSIGINRFWLIYLIESISYILITLLGRPFLHRLEVYIHWAIVITFFYILLVFICVGYSVKNDGSTVTVYILFVIFKFMFFFFLFFLEYSINKTKNNFYEENFRLYKKYGKTFSLLFFSNIGASFFNICLMVYSCIVSEISLLSVFLFGALSSAIMFLSLFSLIGLIPAALVAGLIIFEVLSIIIPVSIIKNNGSLQGEKPLLSQLILDYYRFTPIMFLIYVFVLFIFYLFCCVLKCACYCLASMCGGGTPAYVDQDGNYYDECKNRIYFVI